MDYRQTHNGLGVTIEMPPQAEERIVEQLTAVGWIRELDGISLRIICRLCTCTEENASAILHKLVELRVIERVSSGSRPQHGSSAERHPWAWVTWAWIKGPGSA